MIFHKIKEDCITKCKFIGKSLQFTFLVFVAFCTVGPVLRKKKLDNVLSGVPYLQCIGVNIHTFRNRHCTSCNKGLGAFLFNNAHTAVPCHTKIGMVAECRDIDFQLFCRIQNCCAGWN